MNELEKALSKLTKYEGHPKRKLSKLYLKALKEGKIKHHPGKQVITIGGRTMIYKVEYNKHKYQDCSDNPKITSKLIPAATSEDAGYKLADMRDGSEVEGLRTKQGNRYYIGLIHFNNIELA